MDTVTSGVIEVPGSGAYASRDRLKGSEAQLNRLTNYFALKKSRRVEG